MTSAAESITAARDRFRIILQNDVDALSEVVGALRDDVERFVLLGDISTVRLVAHNLVSCPVLAPFVLPAQQPQGDSITPHIQVPSIFGVQL